jgi:hypothetical protein
VKKLVLPNPTPKISPDPSFSKEGNSCSKQTWGRILNTKDCVSISGYSPFEKGGNRGILIFSQLQGDSRGIFFANGEYNFMTI